MALKRKLTKAEFDAITSADVKAEYKASGDSYVLDTDDAADLIAARDREKEDRRKAEKTAKDLQAQLDALETKKNKDSGDIEALEKSWATKFAAETKRADDAEASLATERKDRYVASEATRIAARFTVPGLMRDTIAKRLQVEMHDGNPIIRVLDKTGKPSAASIADFEKELVDNPEYKAIVIASKATGSADAKRPGVSGTTPPKSGDADNLAKMDTKSLLDHMRGVVGSDE